MARDSRTEFLDKEMHPLSAVPEIETDPQTQKAGKKVCRIVPFRTTLERALAIVAFILLLICVIVIALLAVEKRKGDDSKELETGKIKQIRNFLKQVSSSITRGEFPVFVTKTVNSRSYLSYFVNLSIIRLHFLRTLHYPRTKLSCSYSLIDRLNFYCGDLLVIHLCMLC